MTAFAEAIIAWQKQHGRHDLPWQTKSGQAPDPYAIWVSEIMLQQTQVSAVIPYYLRFMSRFADVSSLAAAEQEEVLQYWSGLGYYSRARNLHAAAQKILDDHNGQFPESIEAIQALPGIGRSTAAAIVSFAFQQPQTILDGNVKRILARYQQIEGWPGSPKVENTLWQLAESLVPKQDTGIYNQGLMDLGATICTRSKPQCSRCPVRETCQARAHDTVKQFPFSKPKKTLPEKACTMLILLKGNEVLLQKRPQKGIWAGMWSLPEIDSSTIAAEYVKSQFGFDTESLEPLPLVQHSFTHFKLAITPQPMLVLGKAAEIMAPYMWIELEDAKASAIPTPVRNILTAQKNFYALS
jgi:A/G-specific adenine glycosylase